MSYPYSSFIYLKYFNYIDFATMKNVLVDGRNVLYHFEEEITM